MDLQTSDGEMNSGIMSSSFKKSLRKKRASYRANLSKEDIESWFIRNPDSTLMDVAAHFDLSYQTILLHCKKYGISRSKVKYSKESLRDYLLSHPDASCKEIAAHFGSVKSNAQKAIIRFGLSSLKKKQTRWSKQKSRE
jgi:hypothetical protein